MKKEFLGKICQSKFHNFLAKHQLVVCDGRIQATSKIHFAIAYDIVFEGYIFLLGFAPPPALSFSSRLAGKRV